jgi:hypothetical protein
MGTHVGGPRERNADRLPCALGHNGCHRLSVHPWWSYADTVVLGNRRSRRSRRAGRIKLDNDFNHAVLIGLRYNFLPPPPPPPVALLLRPLRRRLGRILSCFDWDKATLTDRARQIIGEAADNSTKVPYTRIEVNGYTDTSGTTHTTRAYRCVRPNWCGKGCRNKRSPSRFWRYEFAGADGSRCA